MTTATTNGRARKSLAEQIDRLDGILDGLADGLNEAVVAAVKEAVTRAVSEALQTVLTEVLTNPALLRKLQAALPVVEAQPIPTAEPKPTKLRLTERLGKGCRRFGTWLSKIGQWLKCQAQAVRTSCCNGLARVGGAAKAVWQRLQVIRRIKKSLLLALVVGTAFGVAAFYAGPGLAAAASWLGGFTTALAVQAGLALRRLLARSLVSCQQPT